MTQSEAFLEFENQVKKVCTVYREALRLEEQGSHVICVDEKTGILMIDLDIKAGKGDELKSFKHSEQMVLLGFQEMEKILKRAGFAEINLSELKELTNSAIGGYSNYPDGPDVLAVVVKNIASSGGASNVNINLFWSEAQA